MTVAPKPGDPGITRIIAGGESKTVEFKSSARWDMKLETASKELEQVIVKTVAAFLNTDGGTLLIGVANDGVVVGIEWPVRVPPDSRGGCVLRADTSGHFALHAGEYTVIISFWRGELNGR